MNEPFCCIYCHGRSFDPVFLDCADYYLQKPFRANYYRCQSCGLLQQHPVPTSVAEFYANYPVHARKSALYEFTRRIIMAPVYFKPPRNPNALTLLDYGCGDGGYLASCKDRVTTLIGYEPDASLANVVSERIGLPVESDIDALLRQHEGAIDVITMHFVVEHVTDLHATFEHARRLLKPGGTFYFVVPHQSSWESRLFGKKWHGLDPLRHISFPELTVVEGLAREHGMQLTQHRSVAFPNGVAATIPVLICGHFTFPLFLLSLPLGIVASRLFPSGTHAYWLTKRG